MNLLRLKPHRFANFVYAWCIERIDPKKMDAWMEDLYDLLPWQSSDSAAGEHLESESFMAMMAKG